MAGYTYKNGVYYSEDGKALSDYDLNGLIGRNTYNKDDGVWYKNSTGHNHVKSLGSDDILKLLNKGETSQNDPLSGTTTASSKGNVMPVPGTANSKDPNQINVSDYAGNIVGNPSDFFTQDDPSTSINESMNLSERDQQMTGTEAGTNVNANANKYQVDPSQYNQQAQQIDPTTVNQTAQAQDVDPRQTEGYDVATTQGDVAAQDMQGQHGQVSQEAQIDPSDFEIDVQAAANGTSGVGQALDDYAYQDITNVVDTSTPQGKALAEQLGRFNYIDSKATVQGQLKALQDQFFDPETGEPKIPAFAQQTARNVSKIMSFGGMTGTAAAQAMSQALMEASLPVASADAQFFQGVTMENLSNKQQQVINKAQTLANFEVANLSARETAAVENAKSFLQMDLANLSNDQQAAVVNNQNRVQSILTDANAVNTERLFEAQSQNDLNKYYDGLNASIDQFNTGQLNAMKQFNATQTQSADVANQNATNAMSQFNATLENNREQFYKTMQYNIDLSNAKWRQTVTLQNNEDQFNAAATDVKNMVDISTEQLNQIWDRSDALLDYLWKSSENEKDRNAAVALAKLRGQISEKAASSAGLGAIAGTVVGSAAESLFKDFNWGFG